MTQKWTKNGQKVVKKLPKSARKFTEKCWKIGQKAVKKSVKKPEKNTSKKVARLK